MANMILNVNSCDLLDADMVLLEVLNGYTNGLTFLPILYFT